MISERTYMTTATLPRIATSRIPSGCFQCNGSGHELYRDKRRACRFCDGVATRGVYIVQVFTERFKYEFRFQAKKFGQAVARAQRTASLFAAKKCMGYRVIEVKAIYKSADATARDVVVAVVPVGSTSPVAA